MNLQVNYILPKSAANGPGIRFTIWVQGCSIHCPGCSNIDTWDPLKGQSIPVRDLIKQIEATEGLDGVTITGGEPLDQFDAVYELCKGLPDRFSIFVTTGYDSPEMLRKGYAKLLPMIDILCIGPFEQDKICRGEWKGSSNQRLFFLTDVGEQQSRMPKVFKEIFISPNGNSLETGFTA
jgi:anaerobic ribonucleoside-triphosphate reductase activating protein